MYGREKVRIEVLGAVREAGYHRHKHNEIGKDSLVPKGCAQDCAKTC